MTFDLRSARPFVREESAVSVALDHFHAIYLGGLTMTDLSESLERSLLAACAASGNNANPCVTAIREHLAAGGGRIRARICLSAGEALGVTSADTMRLATICELLHNASLIQDDLVDRTAVRRGEPSVWVTHGDAVAVCAGDLMLSAAYGLLSDLSTADLIGPAIRLVHRRIREVIVGQAAEATVHAGHRRTVLGCEEMARGKSSSLLSLPLELPLLLGKHLRFMSTAVSVASDFAIAYQITDDLSDLEQDRFEGTSNFLLLLVEHNHMGESDAYARAIAVARQRLASSVKRAKLLPNDCASTLIEHAEKLRDALEQNQMKVVTTAGV